jgi:hypothetical protein
MTALRKDRLEQYLAQVFRQPVTILQLAVLGEAATADSIKTYGYGKPIRIDCRIGRSDRTVVFRTTSPSPFGHQHMADRAQLMLWSDDAFNRLPRHVQSLGAGVFQPDGSLLFLGHPEEFCLLTAYVEGQPYHRDLARLRDTDILTGLDLVRADALCDYLVQIHASRGDEPALYTRRVRELLGHGECIMGLIDSYPPHPLFPPSLLQRIEHRCLDWRWKLKPRTHRLRQVHGDFHPWNILFHEGAEFHLLDRSRGEWGDPADDVTSITANYLFFALQRHQRLEGPLNTLFQRFWHRYLAATGDREMLEVAAPYFAFRAFVMASPVWYPALPDTVRTKLLNFLRAVLDNEVFNPEEVNRYCESVRHLDHRTAGVG